MIKLIEGSVPNNAPFVTSSLLFLFLNKSVHRLTFYILCVTCQGNGKRKKLNFTSTIKNPHKRLCLEGDCIVSLGVQTTKQGKKKLNLSQVAFNIFSPAPVCLDNLRGAAVCIYKFSWGVTKSLSFQVKYRVVFWGAHTNTSIGWWPCLELSDGTDKHSMVEKLFQHLFHIIHIHLKLQQLVQSLSSPVGQFSAPVQQIIIR